MTTHKVRDVSVLKRHFNPHADGYLVLARRGDGYLTGWISRHHQQKIRDVESFASRRAATQAFSRAILREDMPEDPVFEKDWQQRRLYDWENDFVCPYKKTLTRAQAKSLAAKVAQDYDIETPRIVFKERNGHSEYDSDEHTVYYGDRDNITLLHELAHAVYDKTNEGESLFAAHHSPAFVWMAIELYHHYSGLDLQYLVLTAAQRGLVGDFAENRLVTPAALSHSGPKSHAQKAGQGQKVSSVP